MRVFGAGNAKGEQVVIGDVSGRGNVPVGRQLFSTFHFHSLAYNLNNVHVTLIYIPAHSAGGRLAYKMPFIPMNAPARSAVGPLSSITSPHGLPGTV